MIDAELFHILRSSQLKSILPVHFRTHSESFTTSKFDISLEPTCGTTLKLQPNIETKLCMPGYLGSARVLYEPRLSLFTIYMQISNDCNYTSLLATRGSRRGALLGPYFVQFPRRIVRFVISICG